MLPSLLGTTTSAQLSHPSDSSHSVNSLAESFESRIAYTSDTVPHPREMWRALECGHPVDNSSTTLSSDSTATTRAPLSTSSYSPISQTPGSTPEPSTDFSFRDPNIPSLSTSTVTEIPTAPVPITTLQHGYDYEYLIRSHSQTLEEVPSMTTTTGTIPPEDSVPLPSSVPPQESWAPQTTAVDHFTQPRSSSTISNSSLSSSRPTSPAARAAIAAATGEFTLSDSDSSSIDNHSFTSESPRRASSPLVQAFDNPLLMSTYYRGSTSQEAESSQTPSAPTEESVTDPYAHIDPAYELYTDNSTGHGTLHANEIILHNKWFHAISNGYYMTACSLLQSHRPLMNARHRVPTPFSADLLGDASRYLGDDTTGMDGLQVALMQTYCVRQGVLPGQPEVCLDTYSDIVSLILEYCWPKELDEHRFGVNQNTSLHLAAFLGEAAVVALLLHRGATASVKNHLGCYPFDVTDRADIRQFLVKRMKEEANNRRILHQFPREPFSRDSMSRMILHNQYPGFPVTTISLRRGNSQNLLESHDSDDEDLPRAPEATFMDDPLAHPYSSIFYSDRGDDSDEMVSQSTADPLLTLLDQESPTGSTLGRADWSEGPLYPVQRATLVISPTSQYRTEDNVSSGEPLGDRSRSVPRTLSSESRMGAVQVDTGTVGEDHHPTPTLGVAHWDTSVSISNDSFHTADSSLTNLSRPSSPLVTRLSANDSVTRLSPRMEPDVESAKTNSLELLQRIASQTNSVTSDISLPETTVEPTGEIISTQSTDTPRDTGTGAVGDFVKAAEDYHRAVADTVSTAESFPLVSPSTSTTSAIPSTGLSLSCHTESTNSTDSNVQLSSQEALRKPSVTFAEELESVLSYRPVSQSSAETRASDDNSSLYPDSLGLSVPESRSSTSSASQSDATGSMLVGCRSRSRSATILEQDNRPKTKLPRHSSVVRFDPHPQVIPNLEMDDDEDQEEDEGDSLMSSVEAMSSVDDDYLDNFVYTDTRSLPDNSVKVHEFESNADLPGLLQRGLYPRAMSYSGILHPVTEDVDEKKSMESSGMVGSGSLRHSLSYTSSFPRENSPLRHPVQPTEAKVPIVDNENQSEGTMSPPERQAWFKVGSMDSPDSSEIQTNSSPGEPSGVPTSIMETTTEESLLITSSIQRPFGMDEEDYYEKVLDLDRYPKRMGVHQDSEVVWATTIGVSNRHPLPATTEAAIRKQQEVSSSQAVGWLNQEGDKENVGPILSGSYPEQTMGTKIYGGMARPYSPEVRSMDSQTTFQKSNLPLTMVGNRNVGDNLNQDLHQVTRGSGAVDALMQRLVSSPEPIRRSPTPSQLDTGAGLRSLGDRPHSPSVQRGSYSPSSAWQPSAFSESVDNIGQSSGSFREVVSTEGGRSAFRPAIRPSPRQALPHFTEPTTTKGDSSDSRESIPQGDSLTRLELATGLVELQASRDFLNTRKEAHLNQVGRSSRISDMATNHEFDSTSPGARVRSPDINASDGSIPRRGSPLAWSTAVGSVSGRRSPVVGSSCRAYAAVDQELGIGPGFSYTQTARSNSSLLRPTSPLVSGEVSPVYSPVNRPVDSFPPTSTSTQMGGLERTDHLAGVKSEAETSLRASPIPIGMPFQVTQRTQSPVPLANSSTKETFSSNSLDQSFELIGSNRQIPAGTLVTRLAIDPPGVTSHVMVRTMSPGIRSPTVRPVRSTTPILGQPLRVRTGSVPVSGSNSGSGSGTDRPDSRASVTLDIPASNLRPTRRPSITRLSKSNLVTRRVQELDRHQGSSHLSESHMSDMSLTGFELDRNGPLDTSLLAPLDTGVPQSPLASFLEECPLDDHNDLIKRVTMSPPLRPTTPGPGKHDLGKRPDILESPVVSPKLQPEEPRPVSPRVMIPTFSMLQEYARLVGPMRKQSNISQDVSFVEILQRHFHRQTTRGAKQGRRLSRRHSVAGDSSIVHLPSMIGTTDRPTVPDEVISMSSPWVSTLPSLSRRNSFPSQSHLPAAHPSPMLSPQPTSPLRRPSRPVLRISPLALKTSVYPLKQLRQLSPSQRAALSPVPCNLSPGRSPPLGPTTTFKLPLVPKRSPQSTTVYHAGSSPSSGTSMDDSASALAYQPNLELVTMTDSEMDTSEVTHPVQGVAGTEDDLTRMIPFLAGDFKDRQLGTSPTSSIMALTSKLSVSHFPPQPSSSSAVVVPQEVSAVPRPPPPSQRESVTTAQKQQLLRECRTNQPATHRVGDTVYADDTERPHTTTHWLNHPFLGPTGRYAPIQGRRQLKALLERNINYLSHRLGRVPLTEFDRPDPMALYPNPRQVAREMERLRHTQPDALGAYFPETSVERLGGEEGVGGLGSNLLGRSDITVLTNSQTSSDVGQMWRENPVNPWNLAITQYPFLYHHTLSTDLIIRQIRILRNLARQTTGGGYSSLQDTQPCMFSPELATQETIQNRKSDYPLLPLDIHQLIEANKPRIQQWLLRQDLTTLRQLLPGLRELYHDELGDVLDTVEMALCARSTRTCGLRFAFSATSLSLVATSLSSPIAEVQVPRRCGSAPPDFSYGLSHQVMRETDISVFQQNRDFLDHTRRIPENDESRWNIWHALKRAQRDFAKLNVLDWLHTYPTQEVLRTEPSEVETEAYLTSPLIRTSVLATAQSPSVTADPLSVYEVIGECEVPATLLPSPNEEPHPTNSSSTNSTCYKSPLQEPASPDQALPSSESALSISTTSITPLMDSPSAVKKAEWIEQWKELLEYFEARNSRAWEKLPEPEHYINDHYLGPLPVLPCIVDGEVVGMTPEMIAVDQGSYTEDSSMSSRRSTRPASPRIPGVQPYSQPTPVFDTLFDNASTNPFNMPLQTGEMKNETGDTVLSSVGEPWTTSCSRRTSPNEEPPRRCSGEVPTSTETPKTTAIRVVQIPVPPTPSSPQLHPPATTVTMQEAVSVGTTSSLILPCAPAQEEQPPVAIHSILVHQTTPTTASPTPSGLIHSGFSSNTLNTAFIEFTPEDVDLVASTNSSLRAVLDQFPKPPSPLLSPNLRARAESDPYSNPLSDPHVGKHGTSNGLPMYCRSHRSSLQSSDPQLGLDLRLPSIELVTSQEPILPLKGTPMTSPVVSTHVTHTSTSSEYSRWLHSEVADAQRSVEPLARPSAPRPGALGNQQSDALVRDLLQQLSHVRQNIRDLEAAENVLPSMATESSYLSAVIHDHPTDWVGMEDVARAVAEVQSDPYSAPVHDSPRNAPVSFCTPQEAELLVKSPEMLAPLQVTLPDRTSNQPPLVDLLPWDSVGKPLDIRSPVEIHQEQSLLAQSPEPSPGVTRNGPTERFGEDAYSPPEMGHLIAENTPRPRTAPLPPYVNPFVQVPTTETCFTPPKPFLDRGHVWIRILSLDHMAFTPESPIRSLYLVIHNEHEVRVTTHVNADRIENSCLRINQEFRIPVGDESTLLFWVRLITSTKVPSPSSNCGPLRKLKNGFPGSKCLPLLGSPRKKKSTEVDLPPDYPAIPQRYSSLPVPRVPSFTADSQVSPRVIAVRNGEIAGHSATTISPFLNEESGYPSVRSDDSSVFDEESRVTSQGGNLRLCPAEGDGGVQYKEETHGSVTLCLKDILKHVFAKTYIGSWPVESVWVDGPAGQLVLQLCYLPTIPQMLPREIPLNFREMLDTVAAAEWHTQIWCHGYLHMRGLDSPFWRRRYFKLEGAFLMAYHEDTKAPKILVDLTMASHVIDLEKDIARSQRSQSRLGLPRSSTWRRMRARSDFSSPSGTLTLRQFEKSQGTMRRQSIATGSVRPKSGTGRAWPIATPFPATDDNGIQTDWPSATTPVTSDDSSEGSIADISSYESSDHSISGPSVQTSHPQRQPLTSVLSTPPVSPMLIEPNQPSSWKSESKFEYIRQNSLGSLVHPPNSLSLVFQYDDGQLELYADTPEEKRKWLRGLRSVVGRVPRVPIWFVRLLTVDQHRSNQVSSPPLEDPGSRPAGAAYRVPPSPKLSQPNSRISRPVPTTTGPRHHSEKAVPPRRSQESTGHKIQSRDSNPTSAHQMSSALFQVCRPRSASGPQPKWLVSGTTKSHGATQRQAIPTFAVSHAHQNVP
ncbi:Bud site selection protein bud4 [Dispira simplex]|nr:Bud site selection protein bud4 [Dispira simplex]